MLRAGLSSCWKRLLLGRLPLPAAQLPPFDPFSLSSKAPSTWTCQPALVHTLRCFVLSLQGPEYVMGEHVVMHSIPSHCSDFAHVFPSQGPEYVVGAQVGMSPCGPSLLRCVLLRASHFLRAPST